VLLPLNPKLGVVGDVMASLSSSSVTLDMAPGFDPNGSAPADGALKGLAFEPIRPGKVEPAIVVLDVDVDIDVDGDVDAAG